MEYKVVIGFIISIFFVSCEEKLPSNIERAVSLVEQIRNENLEFDNFVTSLNKEKIDEISKKDSLLHLYVPFETNSEYEVYKLAMNELDELLKYNAKYSDNPKIKNLKYSYSYEGNNEQLFLRNKHYILNLHLYQDSLFYYNNLMIHYPKPKLPIY